jgi:hypothetical protein
MTRACSTGKKWAACPNLHKETRQRKQITCGVLKKKLWLPDRKCCPKISNKICHCLYFKLESSLEPALFGHLRFWRPSPPRACRQSASIRGVCATYGKALLLAISRPLSYGKMVPPAIPYGKTIPPQGSYIRKIGEGAEVRWRSSRGYAFTIGCRRGSILP